MNSEQVAKVIKPSRNIPRNHTTDPVQTHPAKKGGRRFAPISPPTKTAGQSTERRLQLLVNPAWLEESNLTHVAVVLFVRADCGPRLFSQDSIDGAVVITRALQPAL